MNPDGLTEYAEAMTLAQKPFPFSLFGFRKFPATLGKIIRELEDVSLVPPYPWGQWIYSQLLTGSLDSVPGSYVELGVGRGGMSAFLGHIAVTESRRVFCYDSFAGLPEPDFRIDNSYFQRGFYASCAEKPSLYARFKALLRDRELTEVVQPIAGFFEDTLDPKSIGPIAFLHIDADLYHSVYTGLERLYDSVVPGGVIVIDDFFHPAQGPARAASEFFNGRSMIPLYHVIFPYTVLLYKDETAPPDHKRAFDGNAYSLNLIASNSLLRATVNALVKAGPVNSHHPRHNENLIRFRDLLNSLVGDGRDIYEYWRCLESFWQNMDYRPTQGFISYQNECSRLVLIVVGKVVSYSNRRVFPSALAPDELCLG